jgi:thiamine-phosphate pyrophosphorylase
LDRSLPKLIVITDWSLGEPKLLAALEAVLSLGPAVALQHRDPGADGRTFMAHARVAAQLCSAHGNPLFVNGRVDVARVLGAHLHLPSRTVTPAEAREHLAPGSWVSVAVHDRQEAKDAAGADLALISPVFVPRSKPDDARPTLGPDGFHRLEAALVCPAFALGGVTRENAGTLRARGVAVIGSVLHAPDPRVAAQSLLSAVS